MLQLLLQRSKSSPLRDQLQVLTNMFDISCSLKQSQEGNSSSQATEGGHISLKHFLFKAYREIQD